MIYGSARTGISGCTGVPPPVEIVHQTEVTPLRIMVYLGSRPFRGKKEQAEYDRTFAGRYMKLMRKNHFIFFGLPFMLSIVAGSLYLQKFTALKWEKFDEKYRQLNEEEMLTMIENKRSFDKKNDYYRLQGLLKDHSSDVSDDYEIVRVERKKEDEPVWWRL